MKRTGKETATVGGDEDQRAPWHALCWVHFHNRDARVHSLMQEFLKGEKKIKSWKAVVGQVEADLKWAVGKLRTSQHLVSLKEGVEGKIWKVAWKPIKRPKKKKSTSCAILFPLKSRKCQLSHSDRKQISVCWKWKRGEGITKRPAGTYEVRNAFTILIVVMVLHGYIKT